ncbi:MAG: hypothetical protein AB8B81_07780 [Halioglobus sp.]
MSDDREPKIGGDPGLTEQELLLKSGESLRKRAENLDEATSAMLDQMRMEAVESTRRSTRPWFMQPVYGGVLAACLVATVVMLNLNSDHTDPDFPVIETVMLNNDFEMLSEDLEFYEWLEQEIVEDDV